MRKLTPILLIGTLSMLFAEVFSGASQTWFINVLGILLTFPLYLAHVMFFLWIALKTRRTSISQLYLFGVLFGLYESWITKVLWAGYITSAGPGFGTLFGIAMPEFPILVFFWHPIMSFILPILVFEILTKKELTVHEHLFMKTKRKTGMIILFLILISPFIARGNGFNLILANSSLIGTLLLVSVFYYLTKKTDLRALELKKSGIILLTIYLISLYIATFFYLLPERIPTTIVPYLSIVAFYAIVITLLFKSDKTITKITALKKNSYSARDFMNFMLVTIVAVNIYCLTPAISSGILIITYLSLTAIGVIIFAAVTYNTLKQTFRRSGESQ